MNQFANTVEKIRLERRNRGKSATSLNVLEDFAQTMFNLVASADGLKLMDSSAKGTIFYDDAQRKPFDDYSQDEFKLLGELGRIYISEVRESMAFDDVLSHLIDEHLGQDFGQFMTPSDASKLAAEINLAIEPPNADSSIYEPACGTGGLVLAQLKSNYERNGKNGIARTEVVMNDIDPFMSKIAAVQVFIQSALHSLPLHTIIVQCSNALTEPKAVSEEDTIFMWAKYEEGTTAKSVIMSKREKSFYKIMSRFRH